MQPTTSQTHTSAPSPSSSEHSSSRKNKSQSQREYRSKEMDGFSELRDALLLVDPFDAPVGRGATRHQLLVTAAKKLRNLADENQRLVLQLSTTPTDGLRETETTPGGITAQNTTATDLAWSTDVGHLLSMTPEAVSPYREYWSHSPPPFLLSGQGHQPNQPYGMALGSTYQAPPAATDMWCYH